MLIIIIPVAADWNSFFGHFHPVLVHLPIGILVMAGIMEVIVARSRNNDWDRVIAITLFCGSISAVLSAVLGWLLSLSGGYNEDTLSLHQWAGIALALLSMICWYLKLRSGYSKRNKSIYRVSLGAMLLLLTITGHLGGTLTHGVGYLTSGLVSDNKIAARKKIINIPQAVVYGDLVSPILQTKCRSCHGESKKKGGLRMDTEDFLMKGGEDGAVIIRYHSAQSELVKRLLLSEGDEHRMPPKGKKALSEDEIAVLKWWIDKGADFTKKVIDLKPDATINQLLVKLTGAKGDVQDEGFTPVALAAPFNKKVAAANGTNVQALEKLSVLVAPVVQGQNYLSVSCINAPGFNDAQMKLLAKLGTQVTWLQLNRTKVTDYGLKELATMLNITRLNLSYTRVSNKGTDMIANLPNLQYLNLTGTEISDDGLKMLGTLPRIKAIYCWGTKVTPQGITVFKKARPGVSVVMGEP